MYSNICHASKLISDLFHAGNILNGYFTNEGDNSIIPNVMRVSQINYLRILC